MEPAEKIRDTIDFGIGIHVDVSSWIMNLKLFMINNKHIMDWGTASPKFSNNFKNGIPLVLMFTKLILEYQEKILRTKSNADELTQTAEINWRTKSTKYKLKLVYNIKIISLRDLTIEVKQWV